MNQVGPRIYGLKARDADIVAILRRGPTDWYQISKWNVEAAALESGSWFRGTIAPQKCDLSPDGTWLLYSAVKYPGAWEGGPVYQAISRLPWLRALAAWDVGTTYTRGAHFVGEPGRNDLGDPATGSLQLDTIGVALTPAIQFAVERRSGWTESAETAGRSTGGHWDEDRRVAMVKRQPTSTATLRVEGAFAAFRSSPDWHVGATYTLSRDGADEPLGGIQWADWSDHGQLLTADATGVLRAFEVTDGVMSETQSHDLSSQVPEPQPPPPEASRW